MTAGEIRHLAGRARIGPGDSVLDLCCGVAGPGRLVAAETGCRYLGVDRDPAAVALARGRPVTCRAGSRSGRATGAHGPFDVVLLLETLLAFRDKGPLLRGSGRRVAAGRPVRASRWRRARPLTPAERAAMPASDTVWPVLLPALLALLERHGLEVRVSGGRPPTPIRTTASGTRHRVPGPTGPRSLPRSGRLAVDELVRVAPAVGRLAAPRPDPEARIVAVR